MEKKCYKILRYAHKNKGFISYEKIAQITNVPLKNDATIGSYNEWVQALDKLLDVVWVYESNHSYHDKIMKLSVFGRGAYENEKREKFRFWFPRWLQWVLTVISLGIALIALLLQLQVIRLPIPHQPTEVTSSSTHDISVD